MATTQFDRIYHDREYLAWLGKVKKSVSDTGRRDQTGATVALLEDRRRETLDGFVREDHDKLAGLFKQHFGVTSEVEDVTFKGWNWGITDIQGQDLAFLVSNKTASELPLKRVVDFNIAGISKYPLNSFR